MTMMVIVSPAKKLRMGFPSPWPSLTQPYYLAQAGAVMAQLRQLSRSQLQQLMKISPALAELNTQRHQELVSRWPPPAGEPCLYMFRGDTYQGLAADDFAPAELDYVNDHLRILSGLYGVLSPRDGVQAHRCEMGTRLPVGAAKNLTEYWTQPLGEYFRQLAPQYLLNCASQEYYTPLERALRQDRGRPPQVVQVDFKEPHPAAPGGYRTIGLLAKRARGRLARFVLTHKLQQPAQLVEFAEDGYGYHEALSQYPHHLVFTRHKADADG